MGEKKKFYQVLCFLCFFVVRGLCMSAMIWKEEKEKKVKSMNKMKEWMIFFTVRLQTFTNIHSSWWLPSLRYWTDWPCSLPDSKLNFFFYLDAKKSLIMPLEELLKNGFLKWMYAEADQPTDSVLREHSELDLMNHQNYPNNTEGFCIPVETNKTRYIAVSWIEEQANHGCSRSGVGNQIHGRPWLCVRNL